MNQEGDALAIAASGPADADEPGADLVGDASFWVASMCTSSYGFEARRLEASCEAWGVCCGVARVAEDAASEIAGGATVDGAVRVRDALRVVVEDVVGLVRDGPFDGVRRRFVVLDVT